MPEMVVSMELGYCKAGILHADIEFVKKKKGIDGIETLEKILKSMGAKASINQVMKMKPAENVSVEFRKMFLDACFQVFDKDPEKIKEMGRNSPSISPLQKLVLGHFMTPEKAIGYAPKFWRENYTAGELVVLEINREKNYVRLAIKNFPVSKVFCIHLAGYFEGVGKLTKVISVTCKEMKCVHDGAEFCEFEIRSG
ncbi:MAG: hypothetical protein N3F63_02055 [Thermoplasmata archaeon]|nr:hypothetical protein [Thermoplasmata archaeon]